MIWIVSCLIPAHSAVESFTVDKGQCMSCLPFFQGGGLVPDSPLAASLVSSRVLLLAPVPADGSHSAGNLPRLETGSHPK